MVTLITPKQFNHLEGFYFALTHHYHEGIRTNFGHWSNLLDDRNVPLRVQNITSMLAEDKRNNDFYLRNSLKKYDILVSE